MCSLKPGSLGRRQPSLREPLQSSFTWQTCTITESVEAIIEEGMAEDLLTHGYGDSAQKEKEGNKAHEAYHP